ncbi:MAG: PilZ domain-containing protein [Methylococcaceae bacterium]|nr:PilZ domain-containing protein [Methylococcaceae bacterium]
MKEHRQYPRLLHRASINLTFSSGAMTTTHTLDMSNSGLFISCVDRPEVQVGDILEVIVNGIQDPVARPIRIIRVESGKGFGIEFV